MYSADELMWFERRNPENFELWREAAQLLIPRLRRELEQLNSVMYDLLLALHSSGMRLITEVREKALVIEGREDIVPHTLAYEQIRKVAEFILFVKVHFPLHGEHLVATMKPVRERLEHLLDMLESLPLAELERILNQDPEFIIDGGLGLYHKLNQREQAYTKYLMDQYNTLRIELVAHLRRLLGKPVVEFTEAEETIHG